jgi:NhaP-type Na+/H+ or K+/H+ antiporter
MSWSLFNSGLALVMALSAVYSIAKMNGTTRHCIRVGILLILIASVGQAVGWAAGQWDHWLDTLLYSGVLFLLIFNRRYRRTSASK